MARLAARQRHSNLVKLVALRKGNHPGEAYVRRGRRKDLYRTERDSLEGPMMKQRLCRLSWRAFASAHPLMLSSTCSREALLACPPCPSWNLPSFSVESTLTSPCSRSDLPLSRQGAALAHLDFLIPHDLVLYTDGSVPFPFGKGSSGVLDNCSLCGTEATLFFSAGPVCSSFSAETCAIVQGLC